MKIGDKYMIKLALQMEILIKDFKIRIYLMHLEEAWEVTWEEWEEWEASNLFFKIYLDFKAKAKEDKMGLKKYQ